MFVTLLETSHHLFLEIHLRSLVRITIFVPSPGCELDTIIVDNSTHSAQVTDDSNHSSPSLPYPQVDVPIRTSTIPVVTETNVC